MKVVAMTTECVGGKRWQLCGRKNDEDDCGRADNEDDRPTIDDATLITGNVKDRERKRVSAAINEHKDEAWAAKDDERVTHTYTHTLSPHSAVTDHSDHR